MKTKFALSSTKLFTLVLVAGFIGLIESAPVFAQSFASPVPYAVGSFPMILTPTANLISSSAVTAVVPLSCMGTATAHSRPLTSTRQDRLPDRWWQVISIMITSLILS